MKFQYNPYYNPEKCGLEIVEVVDTGESYEFDMLIVWKKLDENTLWWDSDSGCSCPVPFDNDEDRHDLKQITKETFHSFEEDLKNHYNISDEDYHRIRNNVKDLM